MCGVHLNRARVVVSMILVPAILLFVWIDQVLISLGQDAEISKIARNYCVWTIPGWFSLVQFDCTKRFLQTIHKEKISTYTQCVTTILHIGFGYLFIISLNLGVFGAAIALNITFCTNFFV